MKFEHKGKWIKQINESAYKNEDEVLRRGKTIHGDPWIETKIGEKTVNIMGVNLKYNIVKFHVEMPEDKKSMSDRDRTEYQLTNEGDIEKIERAIQTAIRSKMGNNVAYGAARQIGIDTQGYIRG